MEWRSDCTIHQTTINSMHMSGICTFLLFDYAIACHWMMMHWSIWCRRKMGKVNEADCSLTEQCVKVSVCVCEAECCDNHCRQFTARPSHKENIKCTPVLTINCLILMFDRSILIFQWNDQFPGMSLEWQGNKLRFRNNINERRPLTSEVFARSIYYYWKFKHSMAIHCVALPLRSPFYDEGTRFYEHRHPTRCLHISWKHRLTWLHSNSNESTYGHNSDKSQTPLGM